MALVAGALFTATSARADLIVSNGNQLSSFNESTGANIANFGGAQLGGGLAEGVAVRADEAVFVAASTGNIYGFTRGGAVLANGNPFVTGNGIFGPEGMIFGPDHNLYLAQSGGNNVLRFDGQTGAALPSAGNSGAVFSNVGAQVFGVSFGPDGNLYASVGSTTIDRINAATGTATTFINDPTHLTAGTIGDLRWLNGFLYVVDGSNVFRYTAAGTFDSTYTTSAGGPLGIAFGPDNSMYLANVSGNAIRKYDSQGNLLSASFATPAPTGPQFLALDPTGNPEPGTLTLVGLASLASLCGYGWQRRRQRPLETPAEAPSEPCAV
jgi:streptogramin lyase